nr:hypothetical protein [Tanacetum cinerariifolium]
LIDDSEALIRMEPDGVLRAEVTSLTTLVRSLSNGRTPCSNCSPASVNATERVVRLKRRISSRASRLRIEWLSAEGDTPSTRAAPLKLWCSAMAMKAVSSG